MQKFGPLMHQSIHIYLLFAQTRGRYRQSMRIRFQRLKNRLCKNEGSKTPDNDKGGKSPDGDKANKPPDKEKGNTGKQREQGNKGTSKTGGKGTGGLGKVQQIDQSDCPSMS